MNHAVVGKNLRKPRVLVAPLDWGLGHATRCIPVIRELLKQGAECWLAGEGAQEKLLRMEFPILPFITLKGYRVKYAATAPGLVRQLIVQSPRILRRISLENSWLKEVVKQHGFNAVISDNRYGLYHKDIPTVFMTHQLTIKSPLGSWGEQLLQRVNYGYLERFTECWVPDMHGMENLSAGLSHPLRLPPAPTFYIGPLTRFHPLPQDVVKDHLLCILSGPEPQRTLLENKIIRDIAHYHGTATIVRGLPGEHKIIPSTSMLRFYNHMPAEELNREISKAEYVISRSGYSTIMDLMALHKKSILIPTPGQSEQEYLASHLLKKGYAFTMEQKKFTIQSALHQAGQFNYRLPTFGMNRLLSERVAELLRKSG